MALHGSARTAPHHCRGQKGMVRATGGAGRPVGSDALVIIVEGEVQHANHLSVHNKMMRRPHDYKGLPIKGGRNWNGGALRRLGRALETR